MNSVQDIGDNAVEPVETGNTPPLRVKLINAWLWGRARILNRANMAFLSLRSFGARHGHRLELAGWVASLLVAAAGVLWLRPIFSAYATPANIASYKALYLGIGQAMIGATAIAGTFVLFAMQVNIERLPYGLFRRFSSDRKLLAAFMISIVIAIVLTCFSLSDAGDWAGWVIAGAIYAVALNLRLLLYAYRRSLDLISPVKQLQLLQNDAKRQVRIWERRFRWLGPIVRSKIEPAPELGFGAVPFDTERMMILQANAGWHSPLKQGVAHAIQFARRAAEQGDTEAASMALTTVLVINASYLKIKGRTFFADNPLIPTGLETDGFINDTLEHLRQLCRTALSRTDEQQIEQVFQSFSLLSQLYLNIEYAGNPGDKPHALLATGYLERAIETVLPAQLTDTSMEGVRIMGRTAGAILVRADASQLVSLIKKIGQAALVGVVRPKERPLTLVGLEQLSELTIALFKSDDANLHYVFGEFRQTVRLVADFLLNTPDTPFGSQHSTYLAPYFSGINTRSLRMQMTALVNACLEEDADEAAVRRVISNIEEWADGLFEDVKSLLLLAVEKRSHFALDMIQWIEHISELLLALATAQTCTDHDRDKLRKHVCWIVSTMSWLPTDEETVRFVETFRLANHLFDIAVKAWRRSGQDTLEACRKLLLNWAVTAGAFSTGWGTLERGLTALIALAAINHELCEPDALKAQLIVRLTQPGAPDQEHRDRAARELRENADSLRARELEIDSIKSALSHGDLDATRALMREIAAILSPGTVGEIRRSRRFG
jgi:hypothetical protein